MQFENTAQPLRNTDLADDSVEKSLHPSRIAFNRRLGCNVATIHQGQYHISQGDEGIYTLLGSCIAVCVRDTKLNIGGMNHFLLPDNGSNEACHESQQGRYGYWSMELLLNGLYKRGAQKKYLEIKVFGGGFVLNLSHIDIGQKNISFIRQYLQDENLQITAESTGGSFSRKVVYFPQNGNVKLKLANQATQNGIVKEDLNYITQLNHNPHTGSIELF